MPAYIIARPGPVIDRDRYEQYRAGVKALLPAFEGRYLVRGATEVLIEGDGAPERFAIIEFPTDDHRARFWESPQYAALRDLRRGAVEVTVGLVAGVDATG